MCGYLTTATVQAIFLRGRLVRGACSRNSHLGSHPQPGRAARGVGSGQPPLLGWDNAVLGTFIQHVLRPLCPHASRGPWIMLAKHFALNPAALLQVRLRHSTSVPIVKPPGRSDERSTSCHWHRPRLSAVVSSTQEVGLETPSMNTHLFNHLYDAPFPPNHFLQDTFQALARRRSDFCLQRQVQTR